MAERERLELVRAMGELRVGMIVVIDCDQCGRRHRAILVRFDRDMKCISFNGVRTVEDVWTVAPSAHGGCDGISAYDVEHRNIWKVIDGIEDQQTTSTKHPTKRKAEIAGRAR